jgi:ATP-binding cassette subfamily C protein LapB
MGNEDLSQSQNSALPDSLLDSFALICRLNGVATSKDALISGLPLKDGKMTPALVKRSAERVNLTVSILKRPLQKIRPEYLPAILLLKGDEACVLKYLDFENKVADDIDSVINKTLDDANKWIKYNA